ncbi:antibiotic biosynthesis monooxygenase [Flavobacterium sp.]|uniref:putative quinol monooxygenase n=1 Tax=Flavobacterium sp. TaxID=239 RepID=UPI001218A8DF|nr:antibiotic biosynthesis monooxygenase [Flavobacterium sp.]RZJ73782.1 MAG: hypothetical protein EOO49_00035 [Flavobacterium sp.]
MIYFRKTFPRYRKLTFPVALLGILVVQSCVSDRNPKSIDDEKRPETIVKQPRSFQELGFFGKIGDDKWNAFVLAVQQNIANSRKESGNLSFSLFQPENSNREPIWFERLKNKEAHNFHKQQQYFKRAIEVIQTALEGEPNAITLTELTEIPAKVAIPANDTHRTKHVITLFEVKSEKRQPFVQTLAKASEQIRKTSGNLECNLYQYADDPNKFALIEGWRNVADQEAHLVSEQNKQLDTALKDFCKSEPMTWLANDISE